MSLVFCFLISNLIAVNSGKAMADGSPNINREPNMAAKRPPAPNVVLDSDNGGGSNQVDEKKGLNVQGEVITSTEDVYKLRDPFRMPDIPLGKLRPRTDLERYSVDAYKLVGVMTGPEKLKALVLAPDGKTYFVSEKMKIGLRSGIVKKITPSGIRVRERIVNMVGQEENIESEIRFSADSKPQVTASPN